MYTFAPSPSFGVSEHPFVTWNDAFTTEELDKIVAYGDEQTIHQAIVGGQKPGEDVSAVRKSKVAFLQPSDDTMWFFDRMAYVARQLNGQFYKFDLYGFSEGMQYTIYNSENEDHYSWHTDAGPDHSIMPPRKFSLVLQLSDSKDYEGGDLQLYVSSEPTTVVKQRGLIAGFPSYVLHRVTPVTSGIRKSLVVWTCGPSFK